MIRGGDSTAASRYLAIAFLATALWLPGVAAAVSPISIPGAFMDRPDLGYNHFKLRASVASPSRRLVAKGVDRSAPYVNVELDVHDPAPERMFYICNYVLDCYNNSGHFRSVMPPHVYGRLSRVAPASFRHFVGGAIYAPDQVNRKGGAKPSVKLKQKDYALIFFGRFDSLFNSVASVFSYRLAGCKAQADTKTNLPVRQAKLKITCSDKALDAAIPGSVDLLRERLGDMGLKKFKIDLRGKDSF